MVAKIIRELKSHMIPYKFKMTPFILESKLPSMRAIEFIRDHVTFKLPYYFSYQMKNPLDLIRSLHNLFVLQSNLIFSMKIDSLPCKDSNNICMYVVDLMFMVYVKYNLWSCFLNILVKAILVGSI